MHCSACNLLYARVRGAISYTTMLSKSIVVIVRSVGGWLKSSAHILES